MRCNKEFPLLIHGAWMGQEGDVCEKCNEKLLAEEAQIYQQYEDEAYEKALRETNYREEEQE
jgi:hypothetical protein